MFATDPANERADMRGGLWAVRDDDFAATVLESERPVVVDFWAAWCPPCRVMEPILNELARERPDVRFVKLDADSNQRTVVDYGVLSMPTLVVFRDGNEALRLVGARPKRRLAEELSAVL
jgi:thioredoxin 1